MMRWSKFAALLLHLSIIFLAGVLSGCGSATPPAPTATTTPKATLTPSPIAPTETPLPTPTDTPIPTPTPLPGAVVIPIDEMAHSIPWLPMDTTVRPVVNFVGFNHLYPPFNSALVRQAFAHAIDRQVLYEMAERYRADNPRPATNLTPPQILGRDLYNEVGAGFDPERAKALLAEAGYSDSSAFPEVGFVVNAFGDIAPGARFNMASAMAEMWKTHLGVSVKIFVIATFREYNQRLKPDPPDLFWYGWAADYNDPDNFLRVLFHSDSEANVGHFSNAEYDRLVEQAEKLTDPSARFELYITAERLLTETEAALIPLFHSTYNLP
jgi:ABC-type oligopeptide transport system substrate-binding subunit